MSFTLDAPTVIQYFREFIKTSQMTREVVMVRCEATTEFDANEEPV